MSASGENEAAVTAGTRCGWVRFWECGELLNGKRLSPRLTGAVCKYCVRPVILHVSEAWCLRESEIGQRVTW